MIYIKGFPFQDIYTIYGRSAGDTRILEAVGNVSSCPRNGGVRIRGAIFFIPSTRGNDDITVH